MTPPRPFHWDKIGWERFVSQPISVRMIRLYPVGSLRSFQFLANVADIDMDVLHAEFVTVAVECDGGHEAICRDGLVGRCSQCRPNPRLVPAPMDILDIGTCLAHHVACPGR